MNHVLFILLMVYICDGISSEEYHKNIVDVRLDTMNIFTVISGFDRNRAEWNIYLANIVHDRLPDFPCKHTMRKLIDAITRVVQHPNTRLSFSFEEFDRDVALLLQQIPYNMKMSEWENERLPTILRRDIDSLRCKLVRLVNE